MLTSKQLLKATGPFLYHKVMVDSAEFSFLTTKKYYDLKVAKAELGENFLDDLKVNSCQEVGDFMHFFLTFDNDLKATEQELALYAYALVFSKNYKIKLIRGIRFPSADINQSYPGVNISRMVGEMDPRILLVINPTVEIKGEKRLSTHDKAILQNEQGRYSYKVLDGAQEKDLFDKFMKLLTKLTQFWYSKEFTQNKSMVYYLKSIPGPTKFKKPIAELKTHFKNFEQEYSDVFNELYDGWDL